MFGKVFRTRHEDRTAPYDEEMLADGQVILVPRANLAAAKALYAAQRAAERRVAQRAFTVIYDLDEREPAERKLVRVG